jgi:hypothetical protein
MRSKKREQKKTTGAKQMKHLQFKNLIGAFAAAAVMVWLGACATQTSNVTGTDVGAALVTAGFKVRPATMAEQRSHLTTLPDNRFAMVKEDGKTYYLYADKSQGRLYVGDHWAYQAYINNVKNNRLREQGAFVYEVDPSNKADNRTVVIWHGWSPFQQW